ncbi:U3 small nucleolar RNA-interacting protein 2 [Halotydeus destructor]|nr:U3 small nucleolar RNA-interacting protein 2 [Halotydeus destructor]
MSFFIRNKRGVGRRDKNKRRADINPLREVQPVVSKKSKKDDSDDEVSSDSEDERIANKKISDEEMSDNETAQEKKLHLAKQYLAEIEKQEKERLELEDIDNSVLANRLRDEVLDQAGRLIRSVAETYDGFDEPNIKFLRNGHKLPITCLVVSPDSKFVFSGSKDCNLVKWNLITGKKMKVVGGGKKGMEETHIGHTTSILCMAITTDGKFLATGDMSNLIRIWNPDTLDLIHTFKGHRLPVAGVAFKKQSHNLYSCSHDRTIKVWDVDEKAYVETLFGHQNCIMAIDSLVKERAVTAGGRDSTVRLWKIVEESQLVFQGNGSSIDCVKFLDEQHFISGGDDGAVCLWGLQKKKPLHTLFKAHGETPSEPNWIASIATLVNTDIFATGSRDGSIRVWKRSSDYKKINLLFSIPMLGFVNSLDFTSDGNFLIAGVGQEHRLGDGGKARRPKIR